MRRSGCTSPTSTSMLLRTACLRPTGASVGSGVPAMCLMAHRWGPTSSSSSRPWSMPCGAGAEQGRWLMLPSSSSMCVVCFLHFSVVFLGEFPGRLRELGGAGSIDSPCRTEDRVALPGLSPLEVQWRISGAGSETPRMARAGLLHYGFTCRCALLSLLGNSSADCDTTDSGCNGRVWTCVRHTPSGGTCTSSRCTVSPSWRLGFKELQQTDFGAGTPCPSPLSSFLYKTDVFTKNPISLSIIMSSKMSIFSCFCVGFCVFRPESRRVS